MHPPVPDLAPPARRRRTWLLVAVLAGLVLVPAGLYTYGTVAASRSLQDAVREAEATDPHWRLGEVEGGRAAVPDERNGALVVVRARAAIPARWPDWDQPYSGSDPDGERKRVALQDSFSRLEPPRRLNERQRAALRAELQRASTSVTEARKLKDYPDGRYPLTYTEDFIGTLVPHLEQARLVAQVLSYDILLRAEEGDADGALDSCRAALNAGRSIGDEPLLISALVRTACRSIAVGRAQRALAQGEPSDTVLRQLQELLEREAAEPVLLQGVRGERAGMDHLLDALQTGKIKATIRDLAAMAMPPDYSQATLLEKLALNSPAVVTAQRAALLRYTNRAVEVARLPLEEQVAGFEELRKAKAGQPLLVRLLGPAISRVAEANRRTVAQLRCAAVAAAAERYRRDRGRWPESMEALKEAGYLKAVPADPYDGKPLRWRRLDDGLVVYSVGVHGQDHGGKMDFTNVVAEGTNVGFRLWDVAKRRQPPAEEPGR